MASRSKNAAIRRTLLDGGFDDLLVLDQETAATVLTPKRRQLIDRLRDDEYESVRDLARDLERDKAAVSRDLGRLFEYDCIDFEEKDGRKIPRLKHETIVVEPIV